MVERNDPCPCGSGKKYKRCFDMNDPNCLLYQRENRRAILKEHAEREKEVLEFLKQAVGESAGVFPDRGSKDVISLRIQMIVAFSVIDMVGSYWFEYLGKTGRTSERSIAWYEQFCRSKDNEYCRGLWKELSTERLYVMRNSLVHFFGMGEMNEGDPGIALAANNLSDQEKETMELGFSRNKHKVMIVRPKDFFDLVREGAIVMLEGWGKIINEARIDPQKEVAHLEGIKRVWAKVRKEGAKGIPRN